VDGESDRDGEYGHCRGGEERVVVRAQVGGDVAPGRPISLTDQGREPTRRTQLADTTPPGSFANLTPTEITTLRDLLRKLDPHQP